MCITYDPNFYLEIVISTFTQYSNYNYLYKKGLFKQKNVFKICLISNN